MNNKLKTTPLTQAHESLGAVMAPFAGFNMPISYTSSIKEHNCVREKVGLFDISHMGQVVVSGPDATAFVNRVTTNDVRKISVNKAQYTLLLNQKGGIIDDLLVYKFSDERYMMVVNASNIIKDFEWLLHNKQPDENIEIANNSATRGILSLQGPKAFDVLQSLTQVDLSSLKYYNFLDHVKVLDVFCCISNTGYTGAGGYEIYAPSTGLVHLWTKILAAGQKHGIQPVGLAARDTLRLEKGYCLYGHEIDESTNPLEAKLKWVLGKDKDFVGKAALELYSKKAPLKTLMAFSALTSERFIPRQGYKIYNQDDREVGFLTSGAFSPTLKKPIALGYLCGNATTEDALALNIRGRKHALQATKMPFV